MCKPSLKIDFEKSLNIPRETKFIYFDGDIENLNQIKKISKKNFVTVGSIMMSIIAFLIFKQRENVIFFLFYLIFF
jgi:hypothetical protein